MKESLQRVRQVLEGELPDRPPLFDIVRNDAILSHFAGETLTLENADRVVPRAFEPMLDGTRPAVRRPEPEREERLEDGRRRVHHRWTTWTEHAVYPSSSAYAERWGRLRERSWEWSPADQEVLDRYLETQRSTQSELGEVYLFWSAAAGPGLMGIHGEVGLEAFSYYLADCPEIISLRLEYNTVKSVQRIEHLPDKGRPEAVFLGDDIAYKTGVMVSPKWLRREYFPRLERIITAFHRRGIRVLFHSDGNLLEILDDLVEAGIDGLNPLEVMAGMDPGEIHRRHPHLFLAGGIDVSQLLPFGTPQQIRDTVLRTIEATGGRLMVGSSTELHDAVPLENYLALWETVCEYRY